MEVNFAPELQAKLDKLISESGVPVEKLIEDALAGYVPELAKTREMLEGRYDALRSGKVKPISRDEIESHFRKKSSAARRRRRGS